MAIIVNDNYKIRAGKPIDTKYLTSGNTVYVTTGATNLAIPISERYTGLTVNVNGSEYWYRYGVANNNLVEKNSITTTSAGNFVTGGTNIGLVNIKTGVQSLSLTGFPTGYNTIYNSLYNYYYRDSGGIVRIGTPTYNGLYRRGYLDITSTKSWIYNVGTSSWILTNVDISKNIGSVITNISTSTYTNVTFPNGVTSSGGTSINASGSLTTGSTYIGSAPVYSNKTYNNLNFRTLLSTVPNTKFVYDDAFVYLSGTTSNISITGATNGLTKFNTNNVCLGGSITGTVTLSVIGNSDILNISANNTTRCGLLSVSSGAIAISGCYPTNSWSSSLTNAGWIGILSQETTSSNISNFIIKPDGVCIQLNTGATNTGLMYYGNYYDKFNASDRAIPDTGWVKSQITGNTYGGALIKSVCLPGTAPGFSYQAVNTDWYIGVSACTCVTLPVTPPRGQEIIVADISCRAGEVLSCILVNGGTRYIYGYPVAEINTKYGSMSFVYNGLNWSVTGISPAIA